MNRKTGKGIENKQLMSFLKKGYFFYNRTVKTLGVRTDTLTANGWKIVQADEPSFE